MLVAVCAGDMVAGKYRVERMLGSGGMGYVVAARHIELDQLVAIKFLTQGALASDDEAYARFRREARSTVRLSNEHIAKVHDVGVTDAGQPFIVMDHLDGVDLGAFIRERRTLPVSEACDYVLQACEALGEAHSIGIVHRDVKLANLFITKSAAGRPLVKVLDFGISKSSVEGAELDVTQTEVMLGSPSYMSPEQMNDPRSVDGRTDIWSLGVVLYRLVGGRAPFEGDTIGRLCTMVLTEDPPPLASLQAALPPGFDAVVARCLSKDRDLRFSDVAALAAALAPYASDREAASDRAAHIAAVLGVELAPLPLVARVAPQLVEAPPAYPSLPATVVGDVMRGRASSTDSISVTLNASWGPAITGENLAAPVAMQVPPRAVSAATIALAAIGMVLFVAGLAVFRVSAANAQPVAATTAQEHAALPPAAAHPPATAPVALPVVALPVVAPPVALPIVGLPAGVESAATAKPAARPAPRKPAPHVVPRTSAAGDGLPLPNDRR